MHDRSTPYHPPHLLQPGTVIQHRYQIECLAGKGGMGTVYKANDIKLPGKKWAVKVIQDFQHERMHKEAEVMMRLNHPHLPHIVDYVGPDRDGRVYLIIEWIEGETLQQRFVRSGFSLPYQEILNYGVQICDCLSYLHSITPRPIVYRDLKPNNVMLDRHNHLRLIDFGIAMRLNEPTKNKAGTKGFAAPEQTASNGKEDHRTDLYNLGALLFYLVCGGETVDVDRNMHLLETAHIPPEMKKIITRLLQNDPNQRYQSADTLNKDLLALFCSPTVFDRDEQRKKQERIIVVGSLSAGAGATFTAMSLAAAFDSAQADNALVEWPSCNPQLFHTLYGERHAPFSYRFWTDQPEIEDETKRPPWRRGLTVWYPLPPEFQLQAEEPLPLMRMLGKIQSSIKIVDVGDQWQRDSVKQLCKAADSICFVADPFPGKFNSICAQTNMKIAMTYKHIGKEVIFIANRWNQAKGLREWLHSFPWKPSIFLPLIDYERVFYYAWKGEIVHENKKDATLLNQAVSAYISEQLSRLNSGVKHKKSKKFGLFV